MAQSAEKVVFLNARASELRRVLSDLINHALPVNWNEAYGPDDRSVGAWRAALQALDDKRYEEPTIPAISREEAENILPGLTPFF